MSGTSHPILGNHPGSNQAATIGSHDQRISVAPTAARTEPFPPLYIKDNEPTRFYKCPMENHHMIRTDGKKLAFLFRILETRDVNDIMYLDYEIEMRNPFLSIPTEDEIAAYKMQRNPMNTMREIVSKEMEAVTQQRLSEQLRAAVDKRDDLTSEQKDALKAAITPVDILTDAQKLAGIDAASKMEKLKLAGATAVSVPMTASDIQKSLVGSNRVPNQSNSSTGSGMAR